jgi:transcriptional regulator with XRE-family HTH domain
MRIYKKDFRNAMQRRQACDSTIEITIGRTREKMQQWGITVSFLAAQLGVSRQYAWQIVHQRTSLSAQKAAEVEGAVDGIISGRKHLQSFGERLRAARIVTGLTLRQVAGLIGYSWVGVERWEKNICRPKPGVLWHLYALYGIQEGAEPDPLPIRTPPYRRTGSDGPGFTSSGARSIHPGMRPRAAGAE